MSLALLTPTTTAFAAAASTRPGVKAANPETQVVGQTQLESASGDPSTAKQRHAAEDSLISDGAQDGVLYDASEVDSSVVDGAAVAWSDSVDLDKVMVTRDDQPSGTDAVLGAGTVASNDPDAADQTIAQLGNTGFTNVSGVVGSSSGGNVTIYVSGFKLTSGWVRWRVAESKSDRNIFAYAHWATAHGKDVSGFNPSPMRVDVRSRPTSGHFDEFLQLRDYWPKTGSANCSSGQITIGAAGFSASLPLQNCNGLNPDPDAQTITMRNVWDAGNCKDSLTEGADLAMAVDVKPGVNPALLSDYSYARFSGPYACDLDQSDDVRAIYADPGW